MPKIRVLSDQCFCALAMRRPFFLEGRSTRSIAEPSTETTVSSGQGNMEVSFFMCNLLRSPKNQKPVNVRGWRFTIFVWPNILRKMFFLLEFNWASKDVVFWIETGRWLSLYSHLAELFKFPETPSKRCPLTFSSEGVLLLSATGNVLGGNQEFHSWFTSSHPFISHLWVCTKHLNAKFQPEIQGWRVIFEFSLGFCKDKKLRRRKRQPDSVMSKWQFFHAKWQAKDRSWSSAFLWRFS